MPDNQSTYSTQRGCSSHLEFDFKRRLPADCSVVGRLTQCILSGHSGKTPPAGRHCGLGPDFSKCRLLPRLPDGVVSVQGSSPQAGRSVSPGLGLLSHSPGAGKGKGALTSLFENLPAARTRQLGKLSLLLPSLLNTSFGICGNRITLSLRYELCIV